MSTDGQDTKFRRNIAKNFNRLSRVHERYRRQTGRRQTDGRQVPLKISEQCYQHNNKNSSGDEIANVNFFYNIAHVEASAYAH